jgi:hypothetical protein
MPAQAGIAVCGPSTSEGIRCADYTAVSTLSIGYATGVVTTKA